MCNFFFRGDQGVFLKVNLVCTLECNVLPLRVYGSFARV